MNKNKNTKGFTLIELLIVILIIGILAVAFLPTVFGAPSKARDQARLADLNRIQKVLVAGSLQGVPVPGADACLDPTATAVGGILEPGEGAWEPLLPDLGGTLPTDPSGRTVSDGTLDCAGTYLFLSDPGATGTYDFGLYSTVENTDAGNMACTLEALGDPNVDPWDLDAEDALAGSGNCFGLLQSL
ncbi:hypothetical protein CVV38_01840 [Candidatus Peregrinibacteria bacterium HGW-Peregrinibacteria-1]|nr:MAG: hypothetical protein CVV38_01840 [Candidatus Peregrinibacteria bacterium HGW-Peregrinibacteria-1]